MRSHPTPAFRCTVRRRLFVALFAASVAVPMLSLPVAAQESTAEGTPAGTETTTVDSAPAGDTTEIFFIPPTPAPTFDTDGDGLSDTDERGWGLDPYRYDTDYDGIGDGDELYDRYGLTNPIDPDTDDDGLRDGAEVFVYGTDPFRSDTDGDGYSDLTEIQWGRDPRVAYR